MLSDPLMPNILEVLRTIFRRWSGTFDKEPKPLQINLPQSLDENPLHITLREDCLQCEQALVWFDRESQATPLTSRAHQMLLSCLTATAATTMRRLAPEALEKLYLQTQDTPSPSTLAAFLRATSECVGKDRLHQIKISDYTLHSDRQGGAKDTGLPVHGIGMDSPLVDQRLTFGPLLWKIWNLHTLELELTAVLEFTDAFVERLADACPQVTHLRLCGPPFENRSGPLDREPGMTLDSLRILGEKCPELAELQIEINATQLGEGEYDGGASRQTSKLIELGVGMSPIAQPEKVAAHIMSMFPDLLQLSWYEGRWFEDGVESLELGRIVGWERVREEMGLFPYEIMESEVRFM